MIISRITSKSLLTTLSVLIILFALIYFLTMYVFSGLGTSFAKDCSKIKEGMTKDQTIQIMKNNENKNDISFKIKDNQLVYTTPGFSGDYQCYIQLNDQSNVEYVTKIFD